jgi:hypothetical protein
MNYSYYRLRKDFLLNNFKTRVTFPVSLLKDKEPALCVQESTKCTPEDYASHDAHALRNFAFEENDDQKLFSLSTRNIDYLEKFVSGVCQKF